MTVELATAGVPASVLSACTSAQGVVTELVEQARGEMPALARLQQREQLLLAGWLVSLRSARTRRSYAADALAWRDWLANRQVDVLAVGRVHVDLWVRTQREAGAAASTVCRRLSALSSLYRYAASHGLVEAMPTEGVARPTVDPDTTATVGLDRAQARALVAAADADTGPARYRTAALIRLLLHNGLRVDELLATDIADLGHDRGHRVLTLTRKGGRMARVPLAPATWAALEVYLEHRADQAGLDDWRGLSGPLLATHHGHRLRQSYLWRLVRRLARAAGLECWRDLSPHSLRHSAITLALDAGASLRDVQDYAGHRDPRTTRRYDHTRAALDRHPTYTVASYLA